MEQKQLNIATGLVTYRLNDACEIRINPTDTGFVERLFHIFDTLEARQGELEAKVKAAQQREVFDIARKADAEMRELIDGALGVGVCAALFGDVNCYAYADGFPVWANLLFAIMDECGTSFTEQQKLTNPRLEKYMAKYNRK